MASIYNPTDDCVHMLPRNSASCVRFNTTTKVWETYGDKFPMTEQFSNDKWGSPAISSYDNCYYAIPMSLVLYHKILKIDPKRGTTVEVGEDLRPLAGHAKYFCWGDAIAGADGCIYGLPAQGKCVLRFDPRTNKASTFGHVEDINLERELRAAGTLTNPKLPHPWKYLSGGLDASGRYIFAFPMQFKRVLCVDTEELTVELIGDVGGSDGSTFFETCKFSCAICAGDNCFYSFEITWKPISMGRVLRLDPVKKTVSVFGLLQEHGSGWHISGIAAKDGCIYVTGGNAVTQIDPFAGTVRKMSHPLPSKSIMRTFGYGAQDRDGNIWMTPNFSGPVVRIAARQPQTPFLTTLLQSQHHLVLQEGLRDLRCYGPALVVAMWREAVRVGGDSALVSGLLDAAATTLPTVIVASINKDNGKTAALLLRTMLRVMPPQVV